MLLGDPGSGKSTFVRQLSAACAAALLQTTPITVDKTRPLPIFVILHELIPELAALNADETFAAARQRERRARLVSLLTDEWIRRLGEWGAEELADELLRIAKNEATLLVLDGLDEVPEQLRPLLFEAIPLLLRAYPAIERIIVTCRSRSYFDGMLPGFRPYTLAPFNGEQVNHFIAAWYSAQRELGRMDERRATQQTSDLQAAAATDNLHELAANPMLLTTMIIIHQRETRLPDQRVELYALAVDVLMNRWQQSKEQGGVSEKLSALLGDGRKLRRILETMAYTAHANQAAGDETAAEGGRNQQQALGRGDLLVLLETQLNNDAALAAEFLDYIDHRAGLLVGRGGTDAAGQETRKPPIYSFPHRTFQEYLAGCHMTRGRDYRRVFRRQTAAGDYWRVAVILGAEELYYNNDNETAVLDLAYNLCPAAPPADESQWRGLLWSAQMACLVGRTTIEADSEPDGGQAYIERLLERLVELPSNGYLSLTERAEAGRALGELGDPRFDPDAWHLPAEDNLGFIEIPAGTFLMGSDPKVDESAYDDEKPQHEQTLDRFFISRYQVTVDQWRRYGEESGHDADERSLHDPTNNPVRYVAWAEAMQYCQWLTERLREWDDTPQPLKTLLREGNGDGRPWHITLPSEAQWERAPRGTDGRIYPWGNKFDAEQSKELKTRSSQPIAVGFAPQIVSPEGCLDMSGNLFDWTLSRWDDDDGNEFGYPYNSQDGREDLGDADAARVVRGGSFGPARCACRINSFGRIRDSDVGFRLVVAPFPLNSE